MQAETREHLIKCIILSRSGSDCIPLEPMKTILYALQVWRHKLESNVSAGKGLYKPKLGRQDKHWSSLYPRSHQICVDQFLKTPEAATWAGGRLMPLIHIPGQCGQPLHTCSTYSLGWICSYEQYALVHYTWIKNRFNSLIT